MSEIACKACRVLEDETANNILGVYSLIYKPEETQHKTVHAHTEARRKHKKRNRGWDLSSLQQLSIPLRQLR